MLKKRSTAMNKTPQAKPENDMMLENPQGLGSTAARCKTQVCPTRDTNLVLLFSPVPHSTAAFRDRNQLIRNSVGEFSIATLLRCIDDPLDGGAAALTEVQRVRYLQGSTTTCDTLLLSDAEKRSNGVNYHVKVKRRVEGQL